MIRESAPWKTSLRKDAELLTRWAVKPPTDQRAFLIERKLFLAAYTLRKLADDHKLSSGTLEAHARVKVASPRKPRFSGIQHSLDQYFDFENQSLCAVPWRRVVNMMIHSAAFSEVEDDKGCCVGFLVTSDRELARGLIQVELADFLDLMRVAADDFPSSLTQAWDSKANRWNTWAGHDEDH